MLFPLLIAAWRTVSYKLLQAPLDVVVISIEHDIHKPNSRTGRPLPNSNSDMHHQPNKYSYQCLRFLRYVPFLCHFLCVSEDGVTEYRRFASQHLGSSGIKL